MSAYITLDEFIAAAQKGGWPNNAWVTSPGWESLYVRYGRRAVLGKVRNPTLDFANITVKKGMRGKGVFTALVNRLRKQYPELHLFVESTHQRFGDYLDRLGFTNVGGEIFQSWFLEAGSVCGRCEEPNPELLPGGCIKCVI